MWPCGFQGSRGLSRCLSPCPCHVAVPTATITTCSHGLPSGVFWSRYYTCDLLCNKCQEMEFLILHSRWMRRHSSWRRDSVWAFCMLLWVHPWDGSWQKQSHLFFWVISGVLGTELGPPPRDRLELSYESTILREEQKSNIQGRVDQKPNCWPRTRQGQNQSMQPKSHW